MTKKIAFGTTLLDKGLQGDGIDGIGQYCQELLSQFINSKNELEISPYSFGTSQSPSGAIALPTYSNYLTRSLLKLDAHSVAREYFDEVDLIHCTDQLVPVARNTPLVATVMDAIPLSHPQFIKAQSRFLKPLLWKKLTARANHIITISEFSKGEIINLMGYPEEKITTIPLGVDSRFFETISQEDIAKTLSKLKIDRSFFLFIGSIQPRKNLLRILEAHALLPHNLAIEFPLVIAGKIAWDDGKTLAAIKQGIQDNRCIWLNYVGDYEKRCLLQSTKGLVFASLYEGFGLPILEAYASQAPVIASNCTSMIEVSGNSAILVNPELPEDICNSFQSLINKPSIIEKMKSEGLMQAKQFTWDRVASDTLKVYRRLF
jgi:glycosyltransferase involved in cell wall biosynthesis